MAKTRLLRARYITPWKLKDGRHVTIRPIRPEDEPLMVKFHEKLSDRSVYYRYFAPLKLEQRVAHERLARICFIDYDREMALVVEHADAKTGEVEFLGVGRLSKLRQMNEGEFALTVADECQRNGLGHQLLKMLVQIGRDENLAAITAAVLSDNHDMVALARHLGFEVTHVPGGKDCQLRLAL